MELNNCFEDHYKEYYYKISSNGRKLYYQRTSEGQKRIAKSKIPFRFVESIKPYDERLDADWLKQKKRLVKDIEETKTKLKELETRGLSEKNYRRSKKVLEDRISSWEYCVKSCEEFNKKYSEERYKEETGKYGGFKNFFKKKYKEDERFKNNKHKVRNPYKYETLIKENIIDNKNTSYKEARKRYKRWLVKNHPDKGGDEIVCRDVIEEFKCFEETNKK